MSDMELESWTMIGYREPQSHERNQGYGPDKLWPIFQSDKYPLLRITRVRNECTTHRGWTHADLHWLKVRSEETVWPEADTCEDWKQHAEIHGWELVREPVLQVTVRRKPFKKQNETELFSLTFDEWMEWWSYENELPDGGHSFTTDPNEIVTAYEAWIEAKSISPQAEKKRKVWRDYIESDGK